MHDNLVTLTTYTYSSDTMMLAARLDDAGIKYFLKDENLISADPFLSNAVGGVKVQVCEADYDRARAVLDEVNAAREASEKAEGEKWKGYKKVTVFCPLCDSSDVYRKNVSFLASFSAREHVCANCGHVWKI
ncbi:MAG: DUF2007 domain-containing protein [Bacteroidetes bacterium]|nr:DUF2007 domain-containing protein [Bacteroidota bacterium]